jgi:pimeloyl-ACP methyl ester carboxylesterase
MARSAEKLIQTLDPHTPVVLIGHSLGGLSLRVFLKMFQNEMIDRSRPVIGGIFISEGYYGDSLAYTLYAFRKQLFRFIANSDTDTGKIALRWLHKMQQNIQSGAFTIEQLLEQALGNDIIMPMTEEVKKAIEGVIGTFADNPEALGQILRLTVHSLVPPEFITGLSGEKLWKIGCKIAGVRSLSDPHAILAQTTGIHELHVCDDEEQLQVKGNIPTNNTIPQLPINGFDLSAHQKYPEVAGWLIGV